MDRVVVRFPIHGQCRQSIRRIRIVDVDRVVTRPAIDRDASLPFEPNQLESSIEVDFRPSGRWSVNDVDDVRTE